MGRSKAEMGRVREGKRREEKKRKNIKKRKSPKKEDPGARKGRKVAKHCVFPMICGSRGSKSRLAKAAGAEPAGQMRDEKLHAVVARSRFPSQNVQNTSAPDHFWKLRCRKSARCCGAKHVSKSKCTKHLSSGALSEVAMSKKCTPLWREAHFEVKMCKTHQVRTTFGSWDVEKVHAVVARSTLQSQKCKGKWWFRNTFGRSDVVSRGRRKGLRTLSKVSKTWGVCDNFKNAGRHGTYAEDLAKCISRGRRSTRDMFIRAVRRSRRWFPERVCILEHQIFSFGKMILRDRWSSTLYDLASLFRGRRRTLDRWRGKIAKRIGTRLSALHSTFHIWRRSRRIVLFLTLSSSKFEEVSQIVLFLTLSSSKFEEVSQNCSPHWRVGFLFLVLYPPPPPPILSNYCCGVHRACTNNPLKSDRRKLDDKAGKPV